MAVGSGGTTAALRPQPPACRRGPGQARTDDCERSAVRGGCRRWPPYIRTGTASIDAADGARAYECQDGPALQCRCDAWGVGASGDLDRSTVSVERAAGADATLGVLRGVAIVIDRWCRCIQLLVPTRRVGRCVEWRSWSDDGGGGACSWCWCYAWVGCCRGDRVGSTVSVERAAGAGGTRGWFARGSSSWRRPGRRPMAGSAMAECSESSGECRGIRGRPGQVPCEQQRGIEDR
jgi:hypothetical protein